MAGGHRHAERQVDETKSEQVPSQDHVMGRETGLGFGRPAAAIRTD
jgi:hypothetical protein